MIHAVFFDLFETLITEWEGGKKKAIYSTHKLGLNSNVFSKEWKIRKELQSIGKYPNYSSVLEEILKKHRVEYEMELIEFLEKERIKGKSIPFLKIDIEIINTLKELKNKQIKIGLISNCTHEDITAWESSDLAPLFDDVIFSFQVGLAKPNLRIYKLACERLNVTPDSSLFIGDGGSNELEGASDFGMKAYHAAWFQPGSISEKITQYPKLKKPSNILELI
nr:HAD family hydrolase [Paenibacillus bovis]